MLINAKQSGFTLLEMIVALGIFMVVAVFAVGALVRITGLNRQAQTLQSAMTNLSFATEMMSREMRFGSTFDCVQNLGSITDWTNLMSQSCSISSNSSLIVAFLSTRTAKDSHNNVCRLINVYMFTPNGSNWYLKKAQQDSCGQSLSANDFSSILDDENINLTGYEFGVYKGTNNYDWIFFRLKGFAGVRPQDQNIFDVQTSVSERIADQ